MKTVKIILFIIISIVFFYLLNTIWYFDNDKAFNSILTFLSITTGFTITALSIIATSSFSKKLFQKESLKNNSKTLLHELVDLFKNSTVLFIVTIVLILFYQFLPSCNKTLFKICIYNISYESLIKSTIWYSTILSFYNFINLLFTFSQFIIRSVSATK